MRFYSENGEDAFVWQVLHGKTDGYFVDVGATEGKWLNNTLLFEEAGWKGLCIEAHPLYYEILACTRKCLSLWAVIGAEDVEHVPFKMTHFGALSSSLMTLEQEVPWTQYYEGALNVKVPQRKLDTILEDFGQKPIDFVSIDVEGYEVEVMKGFTLDAWRPRIVIIEVNTEPRLHEIDEIFRKSNYMRSGEFSTNRFYFRDEDDIKRALNASVNRADQYLHQHPLAKAL